MASASPFSSTTPEALAPSRFTLTTDGWHTVWRSRVRSPLSCPRSRPAFAAPCTVREKAACDLTKASRATR